MATTINPYADRERAAGEAPGVTMQTRNHRYTVPDAPSTTDPGYDQEVEGQLHTGPHSVPSDVRIGVREPQRTSPNDTAYVARRESDRFARQSDERTAPLVNIHQQKVAGGQNPLWVQERLPTRPTADDRPSYGQVRRYWHLARNIKDAVGEHAVAHFSLAGHRRLYEIYGMKPQNKIGANTFRKDPQPWDRNLVVAPTASDSANTQLFASGNRNYRK